MKKRAHASSEQRRFTSIEPRRFAPSPATGARHLVYASLTSVALLACNRDEARPDDAPVRPTSSTATLPLAPSTASTVASATPSTSATQGMSDAPPLAIVAEASASVKPTIVAKPHPTSAHVSPTNNAIPCPGVIPPHQAGPAVAGGID